MKPFLLLATRPEDAIARAEYEAFRTGCGLGARDLQWIRMNQAPLGSLDLDGYSGIVLGGSPFNTTDTAKSATQVRVESELAALVEQAVERDVPFLGACYGIGAIGQYDGGVVDRRFGEPIGAVEVTLTEAGREDPLFAGMPETFAAFVGHKEACSVLPEHAVLLASSDTCPVQAFRIGNNVYATQFHPELSVDDLVERVRDYRHEGYFDPTQLEATIETVNASVPVTEPRRMLAAFAHRYAR